MVYWLWSYSSAAVMTRAFPDYTAQRKDLLLLQNIASYMLLSCGVIYVICVRYLTFNPKNNIKYAYSSSVLALLIVESFFHISLWLYLAYQNAFHLETILGILHLIVSFLLM